MCVEIFDRNGTVIEARTLTFAGGERHVQIDPDQVHKLPAPRILILRARLMKSEDIMDLLLIADALTRIDDAVRFLLEIPYLPYARQDRVCAPGQAFSLEAFARLLATLPNVADIRVWDCHSPAGLALCKAHEIAPARFIAAHDHLRALIQAEDSVLVCPDQGAVVRTQEIADALGKTAIVHARKRRDPATGHILETRVEADDLTGRTAIITDDICDGGRTFTELARALRAKGAERVVLYVTHGIFSRGLEAFDGLIDHVFTTDSIPQTADPRLTVIKFEFPFKKGG